MALNPRRRWSKDLPIDLCELMNELIAEASSFIQLFDQHETEMRDIVKRFKEISEQVKNMQEKVNTVRPVAAVAGGVGLGLAVFTGGLSLVAAASLAAVPVVGTNVTKIYVERQKVQEAEGLGKRFMEIIKPLTEKLEEIKSTCEKLEEESSVVLANYALRDVEHFLVLLAKVKKLKEMSVGMLLVLVSVQNIILTLIALFSVFPTPEEDEKLRQAIIDSADQSEKITEDFVKMKEKLREFTGE